MAQDDPKITANDSDEDSESKEEAKPGYQLNVSDLTDNDNETLDKLRVLQDEHAKLSVEHRKKISEVNLEFRKKYEPLYEKRAQTMKENGVIKGFWRTALENHRSFEGMIMEQDKPILDLLEDINFSFDSETSTDCENFTLNFVFPVDNGYFTPHILSKMYYLETFPDYTSPVLNKIDSTTISWLDETKNPTKVKTTRTQKNKRTGQTRKIQETVERDSFFNFFQKHELPGEEELEKLDDHEAEKIEEEFEGDYEIACVIRCKIIPKALEWYLGEAEDSDIESSEEEDDEDDSEDEDSEDDSEDDDDSETSSPAQNSRGRKGKQKSKSPKKTGDSPKKTGDKPTGSIFQSNNATTDEDGKPKEECNQQ